MRSGHYNRGKADARRRASGKLRLCSVCCRAHCCGALGRGFCRWRTVRTQVFAAQLAGPVLPTVPAKRLRSYPRRTRPHKASLPPALPVGIFQKAYAKKHASAVRFSGSRYFFGIAEQTGKNRYEADDWGHALKRFPSCAGRKKQARRKTVPAFRLFVLQRRLVKRVFGKTRLPGDELDGVLFG